MTIDTFKTYITFCILILYNLGICRKRQSTHMTLWAPFRPWEWWSTGRAST